MENQVRKWVLIADLLLLAVCLALLVIDLQIKNDLVKRAMALEGVLNEQGRTAQYDPIRNNLPGNLLYRDYIPDTTLAHSGDDEKGWETVQAAYATSADAIRNSGNNGAGIRFPGEQVGS